MDFMLSFYGKHIVDELLEKRNETEVKWRDWKEEAKEWRGITKALLKMYE